MQQMTPVMIGGNGQKPTFFASSVADGFGFHARLAGNPFLGQQPGEEAYNRAKRKVAEFDALILRARRIANKSVRDRILADYYGNPSDSESASYRRNGVASNVAYAEGFTPVNFLEFTKRDVLNRLEKLDDWIDSLEPAVRDAEAAYGILPEPVVLERVIEVPGAPVTPGWVLPVVGIGAAVALAAILGVFE